MFRVPLTIDAATAGAFTAAQPAAPPAATQSSQTISEAYKYEAFISYRHVDPDRRWAQRLHNALETYRTPRRLVRDRGVRPRIARVFRDHEELSASSSLSQQIEEALRLSRFLVVICSPRTPESQWVNKEVQRFAELGRHDQILAMLIEGEPSQSFPSALRTIRRTIVDSQGLTRQQIEQVEPLAADVRGSGRDLRRTARLRLISKMLGVQFDDLRQRERRRRRLTASVAAVASILIAIGVVTIALLGVRSRQAHQVNELTRQLDAGIEAADWSAEHVDQLKRMATELDRLAPAQALEARQHMNARFAETVRAAIQRPTLAPGDVTQIAQRLQVLQSCDPAQAAELQKLLRDRASDWLAVFDLSAPYANAAGVFANQYRARGSDLLMTPWRTDIGGVIETHYDCNGNVRLVGEFDPPPKGKSVGLVLNCKDQDGYRFLLSVPTIEGGATIEIRRGSAVLTRRAVSKQDIRADAPLRLVAERADGKLLFQVNDLPPLEFEEVFPIASSAAGHFAVCATGEIGMRSLRAERRTTAKAASLLERGNALYEQGRFAQAMDEYQRQAATVQGQDHDEAEYKAAACLQELGRDQEASSRFERLLAQPGDHWPPLAGCQLWAILLRQSQFEKAEAVYQTIATRFRFDRLVTLIPQDKRDAVVRAYATSANGVNMLAMDERGPQRIRQALDIDQLFDVTLPDQRMDGLKLVRAYNGLGQYDRAIEAAEQMQQRLGFFESTCEEYCWVLRTIGKPQAALSELDRRLGVSNPPTQLYIERARVHVALNQWDEAQKDMDLFFANNSPQKVNSYWWTSGCLVDGFLREHRGDARGAAEAWTKALVKADGSTTRINGYRLTPGSTTTLASEAIIGGLTGQWTDADGDLCVQLMFADMNDLTRSGKSALALIASGIYKVPGAAVYRCWSTPHGHELARQFAFRSLPCRDCKRLPYMMAAAEILREDTGQDTASASESAVFDRFVQSAAEIFLNGKLSGNQFLQLALTWKGTTGVLGWDGLKPTLEPSFRGLLCYILGRRFIHLGKPAQAASFFQTAVADSTKGSDLRQLAEAQLQSINAPAAHVSVR